jgi:hypothetical protein
VLKHPSIPDTTPDTFDNFSPGTLFTESEHEIIDYCLRENPFDSPSKTSYTSKTESEDTDYLEEVSNIPGISPRARKRLMDTVDERKSKRIQVCYFFVFCLSHMHLADLHVGIPLSLQSPNNSNHVQEPSGL